MSPMSIRGNILVIGATCACAIALTWGGVVHPWNSARVIVPLCVSAVTFVVLLAYENYFASHPVVSLPAVAQIFPPRLMVTQIPLSLMSNRTSFSGYVPDGNMYSIILIICSHFVMIRYAQIAVSAFVNVNLICKHKSASI